MSGTYITGGLSPLGPFQSVSMNVKMGFISLALNMNMNNVETGSASTEEG